jgi:acyl carrier protein
MKYNSEIFAKILKEDFFCNMHFFKSSANRLCEETDLFEAGMESFDIIQLITFIEKKFFAVIPEREITYENFKSIEAISNLIMLHR